MAENRSCTFNQKCILADGSKKVYIRTHYYTVTGKGSGRPEKLSEERKMQIYAKYKQGIKINRIFPLMMFYQRSYL